MRIGLQWWVAAALSDKITSRFGVSAGLGSGKSHGAAQWFTDRNKKNSESKYSAIVMPTYQKIWDAAIPTLKKVYDSLGMREGLHYSVVKQPFPMVRLHANDHEIHLISANNPERIVAVEYSHAWASEAGILKAEAIDNVFDRVRCPKARLNQIMLEGVPQGFGRFAELFDTSNAPGWVQVEPKDYMRKVSTPKGDILYRRFRVGTADNPFLKPEYLIGLYETYRNRPNYIRAYIHGYFVPLHVGNVYTDYLQEKHTIKDVLPTMGAPIYLTFDFNANPVSWVALQNKSFQEYDKIVNRYVALAECRKGINQLTDAVLYFSMRFPIAEFANTDIMVYGDMSGHASSHKVSQTDYQVIADTLRRLGYHRVHICALRSNPIETVSVEYLNRMFLRDELYICESLKELQRSLLFTRWKENSKNIDKPSGEDWTHYSDALKYFAFALNHKNNNRTVSTNEILPASRIR